MDETAFEFLARKWVGDCGAEAPARIRSWGLHVAPDDAGLFERIAQRAEALVTGGPPRRPHNG